MLVSDAIHTNHYAALTTGAGWAALSALGVTAVVEGVAEGLALPYVVLGAQRETESAVFGRKQAQGRRYTFDATAWAASPGLARRIASAIDTALRDAAGAGTLAPSGWRVGRYALDLSIPAPGSGTPAQGGAYGHVLSPSYDLSPNS